MAYTSADLTTVENAIKTGELSIQLGDMRITYRGIDELLKARDTIRADLASQQATARAYPRHQLADFSDE